MMERNRDPDHSSNSCTVIAAAQKKNNVEAEVALQLIKKERTHTVGRERESGGTRKGTLESETQIVFTLTIKTIIIFSKWRAREEFCIFCFLQMNARVEVVKLNQSRE